VVAGLVGDRYEITGLIASGGMGSVYRARDTVLNRTVALKVLKTGADDPDFAEHFKTEATNAARLSHPNIVQVYDFGADEGSPYMAMEYVDGQSLREVLGSRGSLRAELAARIASQVAAALEHARRAGIVHRDVKPENILITTDGQVKMADFGLSRALAESKATQAEVIMGTAHYLAPEQVQGDPTDHRADIYALGVVLYEMLTGRTPFSGDSPVVIAYKRVAEDVPSVLALNPEVPRELDVVVARATARDPEERYRSAAEMAADLRDAVPRFDTGEISLLVHHTEAIPITGQETIAVPKRGEREKRRSRKRRRWGLLALILALIAATIYVGVNRFETVAVPGVEGATQEEAKSRLSALGFVPDETLQNHPTVPAGHVIAQEPSAGAEIRNGSIVSLTISLGPTLIGVPLVLKMQFKDAEELLVDRGFKVVRRDVFHASIPKLQVISQDPNQGVLEVGATVTLRVSKGPELIAVPDVTGDPRDSAVDDLETAGFEVEVTEKNHDTIPAGTVISQNPKPGTKIEKGETVSLVVSKGPPLVTVPDFYCMTRAQAEDTAASKGFTLEFNGSAARVVDQSPPPGDKVAKGSTITAFTGPGTRC